VLDCWSQQACDQGKLLLHCMFIYTQTFRSWMHDYDSLDQGPHTHTAHQLILMVLSQTLCMYFNCWMWPTSVSRNVFIQNIFCRCHWPAGSKRFSCHWILMYNIHQQRQVTMRWSLKVNNCNIFWFCYYKYEVCIVIGLLNLNESTYPLYCL
jgi:hypothetical protein